MPDTTLSHGIQKCPGCLGNRREADHDPGNIFGQRLDHFGKHFPWHHLASGTQEVELEIAQGCHQLVQVQFGRPGGELDHTGAATPLGETVM